MSEFTEYLGRIKSYTFDKWTLRNSKITPYHLASWGFICIAEDTFQCSMCEQIISSSHLPFQSEAEEEQTIDIDLLVRNFFGRIRSVHKEECQYNEQNAKNAVFFALDDEFLTSNMAELYDRIFRSYDPIQQSLRQSETQSPRLNYPLLDTSFLQIIIRKCLSAFGWQYDDAERLCCDYCGRSVALKNYPAANSPFMRVTQSPSSEAFNPFEEHKYFCKWGSADLNNHNTPETSEDIKAANGWNICLNYLLDEFAFANKKKKKTFQTVSEITKMQDVLSNMQTEFKHFETSIKERYTHIVKDCEALNIPQTSSISSFKQKLAVNRQSIEDILGQFDINALLAEPTKKLKSN